ncbi:enoyl-CoA hydratase/isomerase family protein [Nocardioides sp. B-3]|uniref:enoyl-CoA hydratase/isomerase family protein n=1 Tax=Nocardioides sp. B-3 TaxID=2895565 RepID=UPI0021537B8C|nr:enoyl-CoA hydratase-related protein [Nocardioides sp. B-3]UUZ59533.1 enoyl-CoA hydratase-related protein [Nocardioides sp. B-3]
MRVERDGPIARITLDGPDRLNAVSVETLRELEASLRGVAGEDSIRVIVLTGVGRAFCAGADLSGDLDAAIVMDVANAVIRMIATVDVPVIAAVNGPAAGYGASLLLAADPAIAAESASVLLPFTGLGLIPDGGLTHTVVAAAGRAMAGDPVYSGRRLSAGEAAQAGLVSRVVVDAAFAATVDEIARAVAERPRMALTRSKHALNEARLADLDAALEREAEGQVALVGSEDFARRTARFRNHDGSRA